MKDLVIKETGNSRFLRSAITATTTWEQARDLLINGQFPIDMLGLNMAGVRLLGTAQSKKNLLADDTSIALGFISTEDPTVNDALYRLCSLIAAKSSSTNLDDVEIEAGVVEANGWVDYAFKKGFTDTPIVFALNANGVAETANVTGLSMQINGPAKFIAIYDGGAK